MSGSHRPGTPRPAAVGTPSSKRGSGLSSSGKALSRAQTRLLFARYGPAARQFTSRGRYATLPERVRSKAR